MTQLRHFAGEVVKQNVHLPFNVGRNQQYFAEIGWSSTGGRLSTHID